MECHPCKSPAGNPTGPSRQTTLVQHWPLLMAFSVQLATDWTSSPAPRTVLHAAVRRPPLISAMVKTLRTMDLSPCLPPLNAGIGNGVHFANAILRQSDRNGR